MSDYVIDNFPYIVKKDLDNNPVYFKDIQEIVLSIVLEIDRVCRKNNIPYALAFGSALGLYNYQSFIPWDDDADIAIDYFDIKRLKEAFEKDLNPEFEYICYEKDERYNILLPTFKVKKKVGYMQDMNYKRLKDRTESYEGFFVDIVAFMGIKDKKTHRHLLFRSQRRMIRYFIKDFFFNKDPLKLKAKMKKEEGEYAALYKDAPYVCQSITIPFQQSKVNVYPRDVIYPFKEYDFAGHKLFSFNDIETFCRLRYGEKCLKHIVNDTYIDKYPKKNRKAIHIRNLSLSKTPQK